MTLAKQRWRTRKVFTGFGYQFHLTRVLPTDGDTAVEWCCFVTAADKPVYYGQARAATRKKAIRDALKSCLAHLDETAKRMQRCADAALEVELPRESECMATEKAR